MMPMYPRNSGDFSLPPQVRYLSDDLSCAVVSTGQRADRAGHRPEW